MRFPCEAFLCWCLVYITDYEKDCFISICCILFFWKCFFSSGKDFWNEKKDQLKLSKIVKCYQLNLNSENLIKMLSMMDSAEIDSVVMEMLEKKASGSFLPSMLNSSIGVMPLSLASVLTTSKIFDSSELKKTQIIFMFLRILIRFLFHLRKMKIMRFLLLPTIFSLMNL